MVVCREIESWYLAGLNDDSRRKIKIRRRFNKTDSISKEQFDRMMPERFVSRIDFMQEIMKLFDRETASTKNTSFEYFMRKYKEERDKRNTTTPVILLPGLLFNIDIISRFTTDAHIRRGALFDPPCQKTKENLHKPRHSPYALGCPPSETDANADRVLHDQIIYRLAKLARPQTACRRPPIC